MIGESTYVVKLKFHSAGGTTGGVLSSGYCGLGISTTGGLSPVRDLAWCANRPTADPMPAPPSITSANVSFNERMGYISRKYVQLKEVARFQNRAGVMTAKSTPPIVEWSSARMEEVWTVFA